MLNIRFYREFINETTFKRIHRKFVLILLIAALIWSSYPENTLVPVCIETSLPDPLNLSRCPSIAVGDPCLLEEDLSAPYPECCPRMQCPTFDDVPDELNEIDDDQLMMADEQNPMVVSYDATLDHVCTAGKI